jgi:hypothetical protein
LGGRSGSNEPVYLTEVRNRLKIKPGNISDEVPG